MVEMLLGVFLSVVGIFKSSEGRYGILSTQYV